MINKILISLIEDNDEYREAIRLAISRDEELSLINEFATAEVALNKLRVCSQLKPDIILLDLKLPGMSGLDALPKFLEILPETHIIVLTQSSNEADILKAISLGTSGYLLKSAQVREIREGIKRVARGGAWFDASVAKFILNTLNTKLSNNLEQKLLSNREKEILQLLANGSVKKEISHELNISYDTVDTHIRRIYSKLDVRNAPSAVAKAIRSGLLDAD